MLCNRIPHRRIRNLPSPSGPCVETSLSRELMRREPDPHLSHCPRRVHASARQALEVVLTHRLHLGGCGSDAAKLRADAKASGGVAEE